MVRNMYRLWKAQGQLYFGIQALESTRTILGLGKQAQESPRTILGLGIQALEITRTERALSISLLASNLDYRRECQFSWLRFFWVTIPGKGCIYAF